MNSKPTLRDAQAAVYGMYHQSNSEIDALAVFIFLSQRTATILNSVHQVKLSWVMRFFLWLVSVLPFSDRFSERVRIKVMRQKYQLAGQHVVQVFAWLCSFANKLNINLEENMLMHFPGICPYCRKTECRCRHMPRQKRATLGELEPYYDNLVIHDGQIILRDIYHKANDLVDSAHHLVAEVAETGEAAIKARIRGVSEEGWKDDPQVRLELADATANAVAVANQLGIVLAQGVIEYLKSGCPVCQEYKCTCIKSQVTIKKVGSVQEQPCPKA